jgi:hypothetical protein
MIENVQEIFALLSSPISDSYIDQRRLKIELYIKHLTNAIKNENINKVKFYINKLKQHKCTFNNFYTTDKMNVSLYFLIISLKYIKDIKIFKYIYHCEIFNINAIIWRHYNYKIFKYLSKTYLLYKIQTHNLLIHLVNEHFYNPTNDNNKKIKLLLSNGIKPRHKLAILYKMDHNILKHRKDISKIYIFNMFKQKTIYILTAP